MAVSLELVNFNELFLQLKSPPLIINDIAESSELEKERLKTMVFTKYDSDLMKNVPSCDCGAISGEYNIGVHCNNCDTLVSNSIDRELEPILWIRAPIGVRALINPHVWTLLSNRFRKSSFDVIRWICDTTYRAGPNDGIVIQELQEEGIVRGYNNFIDNFDEIMAKLFQMKRFSLKNKTSVDLLANLLAEFKDRIFCQHLPLINRTLLVIEETNVGTYVDPFVPTAIDAILTVASIDADENRFSIRTKENRTVKSIAGLAKYYDNFVKTNLGSKQGIYRQHAYGSRSFFSFRNVVTSITDAHDYDEIHIPWGVGVTVFKYHIINKLMKRGFTVNQAISFINSHAKLYHPVLDEIFSELINESPRKGIEVTLNRNPSLTRGSIQRVRVTKIKKDPTINTVSFSILIVSPLNADFDGDALNFTLILDDYLSQELSHLDPHKNAFELDQPRTISPNMSIPKTAVSTMSNWIHRSDPDEPITDFMKSISVV
jgi:hypothetical protein